MWHNMMITAKAMANDTGSYSNDNVPINITGISPKNKLQAVICS